MNERPSPQELADILRQIEREKRQHLQRWGKQRPAHFHDHYNVQINACHWAAIGFDNLAKQRREGEKA